MLSVHPRFRGSSPRVLAAHIAERPTPLRMHRPAVPESIAAVLMRCLEKDPADRPQSSAELVRALDTTSRPAAENRDDSAPIRAPGTRPALSRRLWLAAAAVLALMVGASAATNWGYLTRARGRAAGGSA